MPDASTADFDIAQTQIEHGDVAVFSLESETLPDDRRMLLALQNVVRRANPAYVYAEIGSYMGGTLVPHLMDRRCARVVSIDKRPAQQPDERSHSFDYTRSSTRLMLDRLHAALPLTALLKLVTHDCDAADLPEEARQTRFDLGFIDGEHTNRAAFQDFLSLWRFAAPDSIIMFHDANLVVDALANVESVLRHQGVRFESLALPSVVYAIFFGRFIPFAGALARYATDKDAFHQASKNALWDEIASTRRAAA